MVHSMTAFARVEKAGVQGTLSWELRSVNSRYLEPHLRLPESFRDLEGAVREALRQGISRGKLECTLRFTEETTGKALQIDRDRAAQLVAAAETIAGLIKQPAALNPLEVLAWPGVLASGQWEGYNLVIHELAHKLDMLNGDANGLPPLHNDMRVQDWASVMQSAYDDLNRQLDANPNADTEIDPYAAENPAEFFAVTSEYFFSAPDLLVNSYPQVYAQLSRFYRQDPLARLLQLQASDPRYQPQDE